MEKCSHFDEELNALFQVSRDAVVGVRGGSIVLANAAAKTLLGECVGRAASALLPDYTLQQSANNFICTAVVAQQPFSVTGVRRSDLLLLSFSSRSRLAPNIPTTVLTELRTTAQNLRLASELVAQQADQSDEFVTHAAILRRNSYAMTRLARNLADAVALERGTLPFVPEPLSLDRLCRELVDSVGCFVPDKGVTLRCVGCDEPYFVSGCRARLEQLLLNLLSNALRHTHRGNTITVSLARQGGKIVLCVEDDGDGIPSEQMSALFSLQEGSPSLLSGAGLGLYISQGIAGLHGGVLLVQSREGGGTSVRVMLPSSNVLPLRDCEIDPPGAGVILTELSGVLGLSFFTARYMD